MNVVNSIARSTLFSLFVGVVLIVFGGLFLLSNYGVIPVIEWEKNWPLLVIILGLAFVLRNYFPSSKTPDGFL